MVTDPPFRGSPSSLELMSTGVADAGRATRLPAGDQYLRAVFKFQENPRV